MDVLACLLQGGTLQCGWQAGSRVGNLGYFQISNKPVIFKLQHLFQVSAEYFAERWTDFACDMLAAYRELLSMVNWPARV